MEQTPPKTKFLDRWTPQVLREAKQVFREGGLKGVIRRYGWKFFAVFFAYYLIRDVTIYILIPWYVAKKLM
ncbi:hypothetical protein EZJ49_09970 [Bdellovibrio bacteriovorus]|uniref:hypothetical protein n=1 Tax=Bdellovibrio bacteriovorus TaxID=959 RepID=UPI0021D38CF0|nr:hypothetical protein [Bdellovibrio bacteriovorus]UXR63401.1 hypothetical protein EZJ49_09970 [Bdellovibrio bacteriovorus]